jgi:hypothetical protein
MYGSGIMEALSDTTFKIESGSENAEIEFIVESSGAVSSMILHRNGDKIAAKRKP